MTQKPTPPSKLTAKTDDLQVKFWSNILEIQNEVADKGFGKDKGKGGSTLKDSNVLKKEGHNLLRGKGITYDVYPDVVKVEVISNIIIAHGTYIHVWFQNGIEVYKSRAYGGFHTVISPSTNTSYAVHGALTAAITDILFTMLKANTLKSEEDLITDYGVAAQRQESRPPVSIQDYTDDPY